MEITDLKCKTEEEILNFIRERLSFGKSISEQLRYVNKEDFKKEHRRFNMSGFEDIKGENLSIVNEFADLGIYDYTSYLFLDFYKGTPILYLKYYTEKENLEIKLSGCGTIEIIYEIFKLTIFSNKQSRSRI